MVILPSMEYSIEYFSAMITKITSFPKTIEIKIFSINDLFCKHISHRERVVDYSQLYFFPTHKIFTKAEQILRP